MSSSMPWVKLYTEMIDDTKMFRLSDENKWRFVQLLLLAGECDAEGSLISGDHSMDIEQISWRLRVPAEQLEADIKVLIHAGLMNKDGRSSTISINNFSKRQGRSQSEKREQWRKRQQKKRDADKPKEDVTGDTPVTHPPREEESREYKEEIEEEEIREDNIYSRFSTITNLPFGDKDCGDRFDNAIKDFGEERVFEIGEWCAGKNFTSMNSVLTTIDNRATGWNSKPKKESNLEMLERIERDGFADKPIPM